MSVDSERSIRIGTLNRTFTYSDAELPTNVPATRIFELLPGELRAPIECKLRIVNLQGPVADHDYTAISYACGDSSRRSIIICNGHELSINENLAIALNYLRLRDSSRLLWADAICINEHDVHERNRQVQLMPRVYQLAQEVLAWIGEDADSSNNAIATLQQLSEWQPSYDVEQFKPDILMNEWEHTRSLAAYTTRSRWLPETKKFTVLNILASTHIGLLVQRPWFQRAWVVQEAGFAKKVTFLCSHTEIGLETFMQGLTLARLSGVTEINYQYWLSLGNITYLRKEFDGGIPSFAIFQSFRSRHATDPKDKVFALLSMNTLSSNHPSTTSQSKFQLTLPDAQHFKADYRQDVVDIYLQVAYDSLGLNEDQFHDEQKFRLDYLSIPRHHTIGNLPSWVVDWSTANSSMIPFPSVRSGTRHAAGGDRRPLIRITGRTLILGGSVVDEIAELGPFFPHSVTDWDVQQCFPMHKTVFWEVIRRVIFVSKWWASKSAVDGSIAAQWDRLAAKESPQVYCQCLHACVFAEGSQPGLMRDFTTWKRCRWPTRLLLRLGLMHITVLLLTVAFMEHIMRILEKQRTGRTHPRLVFTAGRSLGRTRSGNLGLFPGEAQRGDSIALAQGAPRPFVLRPTAVNDTWFFVGDAFVDGMMEGQAFKSANCHDIQIV